MSQKQQIEADSIQGFYLDLKLAYVFPWKIIELTMPKMFSKKVQITGIKAGKRLQKFSDNLKISGYRHGKSELHRNHIHELLISS